MKVITIGRDESNDVVVYDPCASRHHLQIIQHDDGHFTLADFGSTNGTFINGQKVSGEVHLNINDIVRIGNSTIPWRLYFEEEDEQEVIQYVNVASQYDDVEGITSNPTIPKTKERHGFVTMKKWNKIFVAFLITYIVIAVILQFLIRVYELERLFCFGSIIGAGMLIFGILLKSKLDERPVTLINPNGDYPVFLGPFMILKYNLI